MDFILKVIVNRNICRWQTASGRLGRGKMYESFLSPGPEMWQQNDEKVWRQKHNIEVGAPPQSVLFQNLNPGRQGN